MMAAAGAAGEAVSRRIGDYADAQATATGDPEWDEGGNYRAAMQAADAALVTGLAGGNAIGGAAAAGIASIAGGQLNKLSGAIADSDPTGNANMNTALGNIVANAIVTGAGAAVGGNAGAFEGYNVDRFNRQLHPEEKTLAKQIADKSGGTYTQAQVEDQLRIMGVSVNGTSESSAPTTLIGQMPSDSGAQWISGGTTADGKPILTQVTAQADPQLQSYILSNYNSASPGQVPSQFAYALTGNSGSINVTGPFTKFDQSDVDFMRNTTADTASMISTNAGRFSAATAAAAQIPSPYSAGFSAASFASTLTGIAADAVGQLAQPNGAQYVFNGFTSIISDYASSKWPLWTPGINEATNKINNSGFATSVQDRAKEVIKR
jgi:filamentous hemagglutinin